VRPRGPLVAQAAARLLPCGVLHEALVESGVDVADAIDEQREVAFTAHDALSARRGA
jgi:hypothetical protein